MLHSFCKFAEAGCLMPDAPALTGLPVPAGDFQSSDLLDLPLARDIYYNRFGGRRACEQPIGPSNYPIISERLLSLYLTKPTGFSEVDYSFPFLMEFSSR